MTIFQFSCLLLFLASVGFMAIAFIEPELVMFLLEPLFAMFLVLVVSMTFLFAFIRCVYRTYWWAQWLLIRVHHRPWEHNAMQGVWTRQPPQAIELVIWQVCEFHRLVSLPEVNAPLPTEEIYDVVPQVRRRSERYRCRYNQDC